MQKSLVALLILLCASIGWAGVYPVTYTYTGGTVGGVGATAEIASPYVLTDGYITTQALIDAAAFNPPAYYINGGQNDGLYYGDANDVQPGLKFDLGAPGDLNAIEIHYVVLNDHAVGPPMSLDISVDGSPVMTFTGFDTSHNAGDYGDARVVLIDVGGNNGQLVELDFQSSWPSVSLDEVVIYEPNTVIPLTLTGPQSVAAISGDTVELSVVAAFGGGGYGYQWRRNGVAMSDAGKVSGATTDTLTITDVDASFADPNYTCLVTSVDNPGGVSSDDASLTVVALPPLTSYGQRVLATDPVLYYSFDEGSGDVAAERISKNPDTFLTSVTPVHTAHGVFGSAVDTSAGNANDHPTRTNGTWLNPSTGLATVEGPYAVEFMMRWNGAFLSGNVVRSPTDDLTVEFGPHDSSSPGTYGLVYQNNTWRGSWDASFSTRVSHPDYLEWNHFVFVDRDEPGLCDLYINGAQYTPFSWVSPVETSNMVLSDIRVGGWAHPTYGRAFRGEIDEVAYYDLIDEADLDAAGAAIASHAVNTGAAYVARDPQSIAIGLGEPAEFRCVAAGAPDITYQWKKNGVDLTDGGIISGATTPVLNFANVNFDLNGTQYSCAVLNGEGGETSLQATLVVECFWNIPGDFDHDCDEDLADLAELLNWWLANSTVPQP